MLRTNLTENIVSAVAIRSDLNHVVAPVKRLMNNCQPLQIELGTWYSDSQRNYCLVVAGNQMLIELILKGIDDNKEMFVQCVVGQF